MKQKISYLSGSKSFSKWADAFECCWSIRTISKVRQLDFWDFWLVQQHVWSKVKSITKKSPKLSWMMALLWHQTHQLFSFLSSWWNWSMLVFKHILCWSSRHTHLCKFKKKLNSEPLPHFTCYFDSFVRFSSRIASW